MQLNVCFCIKKVKKNNNKALDFIKRVESEKKGCYFKASVTDLTLMPDKRQKHIVYLTFRKNPLLSHHVLRLSAVGVRLWGLTHLSNTPVWRRGRS